MLACAGCNALFPVEDSVAVIRKDWLHEVTEDPQVQTYVSHDYGDEPLPDGIREGRPVVELMLECAPAPGRVVDMGCGVGGDVYRLAPHAEFVLGIDVSPPRIKAALERRHEGAACDFLVADAVDPPLGAEEWDTVLLRSIYDQVRAPGILLGQAGALLKSGGWLVVATPYQFSERSPLADVEDPAADLRWRLVNGVHGTHFELVGQHESLWVLRDNPRRFFGYLLDIVIARKL